MSSSLRAWAFSLPLCTALLGLVACGDGDSKKPAEGAGDGDSGPGDGDSELGDGDAGDGDSQPGNGGAGKDVFWYVATNGQQVGVSDLTGADTWHESLDARPLDVAVGLDAAWVLMKDGALRRYDLKSHALVTTIAVAQNPSHLAIAGGAVWVTDDNDGSDCASLEEGPAKLIKIDPATNSVVASLPVTATDSYPCNRFEGLVSDGSSLFVLVWNSFGLVRVDAASASVTKRVPLGTGGGYGAGILARAGENVWVYNTDAHVMLALQAQDLSVTSTTPVTGDFPGLSMVASADALYLSEGGPDMLRIDAKDPSMQEVISDVAPDYVDFITLHKGSLYATTQPELASILLSLDPLSLGTKSEQELPPFASVDAIAFVDGEGSSP